MKEYGRNIRNENDIRGDGNITLVLLLLSYENNMIFPWPW